MAPKAAASLSEEGLDPTMMAAIALGGLVVLVVLFQLLGGSKKKFLDKKRTQVTLGKREQLSHDTVLFRFLLPKSAPVLGLPIGQHIKIFCPNPKGSVADQWNAVPRNMSASSDCDALLERQRASFFRDMSSYVSA